MKGRFESFVLGLLGKGSGDWRSRSLRAIGLAAAITVAIVPCAAATTGAAAAAPVIDTSSGRLQGVRTDRGVLAYLGVRYAESPAGAARFLPSTLAHRQPGIVPANAPGKEFVQTVGNAQPADLTKQSEDSLVLNVWTASLTGKRPVMVWIHGGGNWQGSGNVSATTLAANNNVVVVSINYRLGIFGFMDVSLLGGEKYRTSASSGILDQRLALEWVQRNIAHFGGDPQNVTVFGVSAGGVDITAMLATENPSHLFRHAILESGFANTTKSLALAQRFSRAVFEEGKIRTMDDLLGKNPAELIDIQNRVLATLTEGERDLAFQPTVDGRVITDFPMAMVERGAAKDIDILLGTTLNEVRFYHHYNPEMGAKTLGETTGLSVIPPPLLQQMDSVYRRSRANAQTWQVNLDVASDFWFRIPAIRLAEAQFKYNQNVFLYLFNWPSADPDDGVPHASEVSFVFGEKLDPEDYDLKAPGAVDAAQRLSTTMQQYWSSFARDGHPSAPGAPSWPRYDPRQRPTMELASQPRVVLDPHGEERRLFDTLEFRGRQ
jgi:para-nitrobenzyl esterase